MATSRFSTRAGSAAMLGLLGLAAAAPTTLAGPISTPLQLTCTFPVIGDVPTTATVSTDLPETVYLLDNPPLASRPISVRPVAKGASDLGGSVELRGATLKSSWIYANSAGATITDRTATRLSVAATPGQADGTLAAFRPQSPGVGQAEFALEGLVLSVAVLDTNGSPIPGLGAVSDSDGDPDTVDQPCTGPSVIAARVLLSTAPRITPTPAPLVTPAPTSTPEPTPTTTPVPTPNPTATPTPTPIAGGSGPRWTYALAGKTFLKTVAAGSVEVRGRASLQFSLNTGAATATFTLANASARLQAARLLPITADLQFTEVGTTTGQLRDLTLSLTTRQAIRLKNAKVFGVNLVSGTCVTSTPATIPLKSPSGQFEPTSGGRLGGTFTIPPFKSCGALTTLVSGLAAGPGNGLSLTATPEL